VLAAAHPGVNPQVERLKKAEGMFFEEDFDSGGIVVVVEEGDGFADELDGGLEEAAVEGDGAIFFHLAAGSFAEIIFQVAGSGAQAFHLGGKAIQGGLPGGGMVVTVVGGIDPHF
jgi:hypothetical protein